MLDGSINRGQSQGCPHNNIIMRNVSNMSLISDKLSGTVSIVVKTKATTNRFDKRVLPILEKVLENTLGRPLVSISRICGTKDEDDISIYNFNGLPWTPMCLILNKQVLTMNSICCDTCGIEALEYAWK